MAKFETFDIDSKSEAPSDGTTKPFLVVVGDGNIKRARGFAALTPERRAEISSLGGRAAHEKGSARKFDSESGRAASKLVKNRRVFDSERAREASRKSREILLQEARKEAGVDG